MSPVEPENLIRVGDLAKAAGLTVRALHHYEDVGLLTPSTRSDAGHRLYSARAVERVYRINRLRRLGLPLEQIVRVLDDPAWGLEQALRRHAATLGDEVARASAVHRRVVAAIADIDEEVDPTRDLMEVLTAMDEQDPLHRRISILVYRDPAAAHAYLVDVFGMTPGEITTDGEGSVVHAEVFGGDGVIWLHRETEEFGLASPITLGAATATMAIIVDDVDGHHELVRSKGADIVYEPTDQPYGYREYSARDCEGTLWSFMKELT